MTKSHPKILIVEADLVSAEYLKKILQQKNYNIVGIINNGAEVIKRCKHLAADIILMDIMLKDNISGCEAALKLYTEHCNSKIIFVTAYADDEMIDYAAQSHAYGYILKPYREEELFATIKLALSHERSTFDQKNITIVQLHNNYLFDLHNCVLYKGDQEIPLAKKKRKLLEILARNKSKCVPNEQICHYVWGSSQNHNTLRSLIHRIRTAIGEDIITNVNGLGYMIY